MLLFFPVKSSNKYLACSPGLGYLTLPLGLGLAFQLPASMDTVLPSAQCVDVSPMTSDVLKPAMPSSSLRGLVQVRSLCIPDPATPLSQSAHSNQQHWFFSWLLFALCKALSPMLGFASSLSVQKLTPPGTGLAGS